MLWDIPYSKNSNVIFGNSVFIDHTSRPPCRIKIQLNAAKFGLKIILIKLYIDIQFPILVMPLHFKKKLNQAKGTFSSKRTIFKYVLSSDW
jgi:hypothetical protein